ncbi:MAG: hypothetical protein AAFR61_14085 [Bacteroidota bacterium]
MKPLLLSIFTFTLACTSLSAQDWGILRYGDTLVYTNVYGFRSLVYADSAAASGNRFIQYLHPITLPLTYSTVNDPDLVAVYQLPGVLKKEIHDLGGGVYELVIPNPLTLAMLEEKMGIYYPYYAFLSYPADTVRIHSLAGVGESWVYRRKDTTMATVEMLTTRQIQGVWDSVRVIRLSDQTSLELSKSFGIYAIDSISLLGKLKPDTVPPYPDFWQIFDFEVGDKFWTIKRDSSAYSPFYYQSSTLYEEREILNKEVDSAGYTYELAYWAKRRYGQYTKTIPPESNISFLGGGFRQAWRIDRNTYQQIQAPFEPVTFFKHTMGTNQPFTGQARATGGSYKVRAWNWYGANIFRYEDMIDYRPGLGEYHRKEYFSGYKVQRWLRYDLVGYEKNGQVSGRDLSDDVRPPSPTPSDPNEPFIPDEPWVFSWFQLEGSELKVYFRIPLDMEPLSLRVCDMAGRTHVEREVINKDSFSMKGLLAGQYGMLLFDQGGNLVDAGIFTYLPE